jgi:glycosyltransferase involved in cell wall biosynthesis
MNAVPRLSIGLPVHNGENHLAESLDALLGQSYEDFELIISDNASTDGTADICSRYEKQDSRVRYIRQPSNIGRVPNHNFLIEQARGELFKWAACEDLYARDLLKRCVEALDDNPHVVLAHSWSAMIDSSGAVLKLVGHPDVVTSLRAPERFWSMLVDGGGDYSYGVIRTEVLHRMPRHGSYHFADRAFTTEIALHGPFYQVPDWLFFWRDTPDRTPFTVRTRCAYMDPSRADRWRHPVARLYAEYGWALIAMIQRAPLSPADKRECCRCLARWAADRALPVAGRVIRRQPLPPGSSVTAGEPVPAGKPLDLVDALVAGRDRRPS